MSCDQAWADADFIVNALLPRYTTEIMRACLETGTSHLDRAADNDKVDETDFGQRFRPAGLPTGPRSASTPVGRPAPRGTLAVALEATADARTPHRNAAPGRARGRDRLKELITWRD